MNKIDYGKFRRGPIKVRRTILAESYPLDNESSRNDFSCSGFDSNLLELSETMIEQAVGYMGIPLGLAGPFNIDGESMMIPMATEEPSVLAAASYGAMLTEKDGGIITTAREPVMMAQIFLENTDEQKAQSVQAVKKASQRIQDCLNPLLASMEKRGGGWRKLDTHWIESSQTLVVNLHIDVRDAMGANILNSAAETACPILENITGGKVLMAIISNRSFDRKASAKFCIPMNVLSQPGFSGQETARRIVRAAQIAKEDADRAVTHNKGIMNGISALALATGNDTRAIEAAAHAHASRHGSYHGLSEYWIDGNNLNGTLQMPLPFAIVGGAVGFHPTARWSLKILGHPKAPRLSRIAAALGLAQNLSALRALVCEGIQQGHMKQHARRLAFYAGARGKHIHKFAQTILSEKIRSKNIAMNRFSHWIKLVR